MCIYMHETGKWKTVLGYENHLEVHSTKILIHFIISNYKIKMYAKILWGVNQFLKQIAGSFDNSKTEAILA